MRQLWTNATMAVLAVGLAGSMVWSQATATGTVRGTLRRAGAPVAGARVVVDSAVVSSYTGQATTDQAGAFVVSGAPLGGVEAKAYDAEGRIVASAKGTLAQSGETIALSLNAE